MGTTRTCGFPILSSTTTSGRFYQNFWFSHLFSLFGNKPFYQNLCSVDQKLWFSRLLFHQKSPQLLVFPLVFHQKLWFSHWFPTRSCGLRHGPEITTTSGFPNCASTTSSGGTPQDENGFCVLRTSHSRSHSRSHAFGNIMCVLTDSQDRGNAKVFLRIHRGLHGRAHFLLCLYYGISSNPHYTRDVLWVSSTFFVFSSTFLLRFTNEILQF